MATIKHTVNKSVRTNAGTVGGTAYVLEGTAESNIVLEDHAIGTDTAQDFTADVSTIVSLAMEWSPASGSSSCTIETNSSSAADDTIILLADKPLYWDTRILATEGTACPLTVDVTSLFITTTAIGDLTIKDVTKEIELPFELAKNNTPAGPAIGVSASTTINRKDYHINYNRVMDSGGAVVSDNVKLEINLEAKPPRKDAAKK